MYATQDNRTTIEQMTMCVGCGAPIPTGKPSVPASLGWTCNDPDCIDKAAAADMPARALVRELVDDMDRD